MQQLHADGVKWVDLRLAFTFFYYSAGKEQPEATYERMFQVFGQEIEDFKNSDEGKGFWGARMIWTGIRVLDTRKIVEDMDACISIKLAFPHLISGYDLVGQEDGGRPLKDLLPELFWFKKQCAEEGIDIPFFFHAGECLGDGSDTDQNLFDAILLGTRRIGHGFSLYKHPLLIDMVKHHNLLRPLLLDQLQAQFLAYRVIKWQRSIWIGRSFALRARRILPLEARHIVSRAPAQRKIPAAVESGLVDDRVTDIPGGEGGKKLRGLRHGHIPAGNEHVQDGMGQARILSVRPRTLVAASSL